MFHPKVLKMLAFVTQIGISMLSPILLMLYLGVWLENQFELQLIPLFILLGIGAGFRNCYILITKVNYDLKMDRKKNEKKKQSNRKNTL